MCAYVKWCVWTFAVFPCMQAWHCALGFYLVFRNAGRACVSDLSYSRRRYQLCHCLFIKISEMTFSELRTREKRLAWCDKFEFFLFLF